MAIRGERRESKGGEYWGGVTRGKKDSKWNKADQGEIYGARGDCNHTLYTPRSHAMME